MPIYPFPNEKFQTPPNRKSLKPSILNLMKMAESSLKSRKHYGKGDIARKEQFLLFPVFSKELYCRHVEIRA